MDENPEEEDIIKDFYNDDDVSMDCKLVDLCVEVENIINTQNSTLCQSRGDFKMMSQKEEPSCSLEINIENLDITENPEEEDVIRSFHNDDDISMNHQLVDLCIQIENMDSRQNRRWCVSCLWSTATAMLYRLLANPLPQITAPKHCKPRPAGKEHLHPEPKVECVVLHQPAKPKVDVIFVHGLYGSLGNTWRQGEWKSKYKIEPNKISLRRPNSIPNCDCDKQTNNTANNLFNDIKDNNKIETLKDSIKQENENILNFNDKEITFTNIDEYYKVKRITDDEMFITEKFYKEQCEVIDNYDTQAKFVRDLFSKENLNVEKKNDNCRCRAEEKRCEVGCGCICDECYSACWPRDWIREDYPHARVISINYTSDPHLWRPLWIKQCKRLHLHERAEQMISQLIALGVGERPIVWVGHSKGGLFIKQIYCEAYEAYMKLHGIKNKEDMNETIEMTQNCVECYKDNQMNHITDSNIDNNQIIDDNPNNDVCTKESNLVAYTTSENIYEEFYEENIENDDSSEINDNCKSFELKYDENGFDDSSVSERFCNIEETMDGIFSESSKKEEDLTRRAQLWSLSSGFMFYSVPHRGSPLADIKTPFTARSVELLEMGQDCSLVTALHSRWLGAAARSPPLVRSLVETTRTLMAVLWLRIVSPDSADAGIGALCGVSVDHREICKPSSRRCILYTELKALIHAALNKCQQ